MVDDSCLEALIVQSLSTCKFDFEGLEQVYSRHIGARDRLVVVFVFKLRRRKPDGE